MEESEEVQRIWSIREHIDEIESIKDRILELSDIDEMWKSDVKDLYFHIVSSWQLLKSCPSLEGVTLEERAFNAKSYLELAKDKYAQVQSELKAISGTNAVKLGGQLERAFILFSASVMDALELYLSEPVENPPDKIVRKEGPMEFYLDCSICGATAIGIIASSNPEEGSEYIVYKGITSGRNLDMKSNRHIFDFLEQGNLKSLHEYLQENTFLEDGIDGYCPKCDTIYCGHHLDMEVVYDDGFYDCTYGTCPEGHRRIIDD